MDDMTSYFAHTDPLTPSPNDESKEVEAIIDNCKSWYDGLNGPDYSIDEERLTTAIVEHYRTKLEEKDKEIAELHQAAQLSHHYRNEAERFSKQLAEKDKRINQLVYALEGFRHNLNSLKSELVSLSMKTYPHPLEEAMNPTQPEKQ